METAGTYRKEEYGNEGQDLFGRVEADDIRPYGQEDDGDASGVNGVTLGLGDIFLDDDDEDHGVKPREPEFTKFQYFEDIKKPKKEPKKKRKKRGKKGGKGKVVLAMTELEEGKVSGGGENRVAVAEAGSCADASTRSKPVSIKSEKVRKDSVFKVHLLDAVDEELDWVLNQAVGVIGCRKGGLLGGKKPRRAAKRARADATLGLKHAAYREHAEIDNTDVSNFHKLIPNMALSFPFELDEFQKRAVLQLEKGNPVFVAAHTSAGKTVIAEYAIALSANNGGKAVYTSPIKSLSNQKFRDFKKRFKDVGICTGDVTINKEAQCLIMTTEILRSMLYRGDDLVRDVQWVIIDEVHYLNNPERGVIWEETIIMLPDHIGIVMLSATVPNAMEFAAWVGRTKCRKVTVVQTSFRPVPLTHSIFTLSKSESTGEHKIGSTVIMEPDGLFRPDALKKAMSSLPSARIQNKKVNIPKSRQSAIRGEAVLHGNATQNGVPSRRNKFGKERHHDGRKRRSDASPNRSLWINNNSTNSEAKAVNISRCRNSLNGAAMESGEKKDDWSKERAIEWSSCEMVPGEVIVWDPKCNILGGNGRFTHPGKNAGCVEIGREMEWNEGNSIAGSNGVQCKSEEVPRMPVKQVVEKSKFDERSKRKKSSFTMEPSQCYRQVVRHLEEKKMTPVVFFCFSKKRCEQNVDLLLEDMDLLPDDCKKAHVRRLFDSAAQKLAKVDRTLPQLLRVRENLARGIATHHAGLLPLMKEITEILFTEGFVKVLFATETFAMGVNMPAKTVVFTGLRKNDGKEFRLLRSGEYTQMSGRAGRRGIDKIGDVMLLFPPGGGSPNEYMIRKLLTGKALTLQSAFRLSYHMILSVLRVDELGVEEVISQSFSEARKGHQSDSMSTIVEKTQEILEKLEMTVPANAFVDKYLNLVDEILAKSWGSESRFSKDYLKGKKYQGLFRSGRLLLTRARDNRLNLSVLIKPWHLVAKGKPPVIVVVSLLSGISSEETKTLSVFIRPYCPHNTRSPRCSQGRVGDFIYETSVITPKDIVAPLDIVIPVSKGPPMKLFSGEKLPFPAEYIRKSPCLAQFASSPGLLPHEMSTDMQPLIEAMTGETQIACAVNSMPSRIDWAALTVRRRSMLNKLDSVKQMILPTAKTKNKAKKKNSLKDRPELMSEYEKRVEVMMELGYIEDDGLSVKLKGRAACEVLTCDALVLTEVVFRGCLDGLPAQDVASLLTCFVCKEKNTSKDRKFSAMENEMALEQESQTESSTKENASDPASRAADTNEEDIWNVSKFADKFEQEDEVHPHGCKDVQFSNEHRIARKRIIAVVRALGLEQEKRGVDIREEGEDLQGNGSAGGNASDQYVNGVCKWAMCELTYRWAAGESFADVMRKTEMQEGDVVLVVKRLSEMLKDCGRVATVIGNESLANVCAEGIEKVRRDVIFSASLYLE